MYARGSNRFAGFVQTIVSTGETIATAVADYLTAHPVDISGKVDKVTGKSLVSDTEIVKITPAYLHSQVEHNYEPANPNIQTHVGSVHAPSTAQKNSDITKGEIEAKLTGEIASHTHASVGGSDPWTVVKLAQDFTISTTANNVVTGFKFTPAANKTYLIFGYFLLRTATATVGARPGMAWPSGLTDAIMRLEASNSATASAIRTFGVQSTANAASTGLANTTNSHWGSLDGVMITGLSVGGDLQVTLASETAGTNVTMKAGSVLMYREI